jgi:putative transposase
MPNKQVVFANGEFYHVFNRGVEKRTTFLDQRDYHHFLETLEYYQIKKPATRFSFRKRPLLIKNNVDNTPLVEIICYCLMPNHFHILIRQLAENGISTFMSKISNSYTKYFNTRYTRVGPLFQGNFKAVRIESDSQLTHVSRYIHLNPLIDYIVKDLNDYRYSSYTEFLGLKEGFCKKEEILIYFGSPGEYKKFVLDQEDYGRSIKFMERLLIESQVSL